jgi:hypothetical protein
MVKPVEYPFLWYWRKRLGERKGQRCRIAARGTSMNSVLVEFTDGFKVVTAGFAVRRPRGKWIHSDFWEFNCCGVEQGGLSSWKQNECCECMTVWYRPPWPKKRKNGKENQKKGAQAASQGC